LRGRLLRRYKRFLADIETETGDVVTAFCPATGRMRTCCSVGAPVEYRPVEDPDRRTDYDWWSIRMPDSWVVIDTRPANELLYEARDTSIVPEEWLPADWEAEPTMEDGGRLDFRLADGTTETWIEVKSVTWAEDGVGLFPDAPSKRANRHLEKLVELETSESPVRGSLVLMAMRSDVSVLKPARRVDPSFADRLGELRSVGGDVIGIRCEVGSQTVRPAEQIPVVIED
jgi:sugar fermentation stimulation protein A